MLTRGSRRGGTKINLTHIRIYTSNFQRAFQSTCILREELYMLFSNVRTEFSGLLDPRKMGALEVRAFSSIAIPARLVLKIQCAKDDVASVEVSLSFIKRSFHPPHLRVTSVLNSD
jgi:hypothetical protein